MLLILFVFLAGWAPQAKLETVQDLSDQLTPEQKQLFDQASKQFGAQKYADALTTFKQLLSALPNDAVLAKFASESAINSGDDAFAKATLKPVLTTNPDDWQAEALMTRACAESGDTAERDAGMARMMELEKKGAIPSNMPTYLLERIPVGENTIVVRTSVVPWGPYKVYDLGQVLDKNGKMFLRVTLESSDFDQPLFAKDHPKEAAAGLRRFSMDGYQSSAPDAQGHVSQSHATYKFFDGEPSYATVREEFIKIASGQTKPTTTSNGLTAPKQ